MKSGLIKGMVFSGRGLIRGMGWWEGPYKKGKN